MRKGLRPIWGPRCWCGCAAQGHYDHDRDLVFRCQSCGCPDYQPFGRLFTPVPRFFRQLALVKGG